MFFSGYVQVLISVRKETQRELKEEKIEKKSKGSTETRRNPC